MTGRELLSAIVPLRHTIGPTAILGCVRTIVVDAINRAVWRWSSPHVGQEVGKRVQPAVAHRDAAPPVVLEMLRPWTQATVFHCRPNPVFGRSTVPRGMPVPVISLGHAFAVVASTRSAMASAQIAYRRRCDHAAIASADDPTMIRRSQRRFSCHHQTAEPQSEHVDPLHLANNTTFSMGVCQ